jgi:MinD-like ATPase involved in chromosome partitioning or flagellar assembly
MTVLAFGSVKASPGVTTAVTVLGHVWPTSREVLIAECDPSGGDLTERLGLDSAAGLVPLAANVGDHLTADALWSQVQRAGDVAILSAAPAGAAVREALLALGPQLAAALQEAEADALIDCGRLWPGSTALPLARAAQLVVVVARATDEEVPRLPYAVAELGLPAGAVLLLIGEPEVGKPFRAAAKVEDATGLEVVGVLPHDPRGARGLGSRRRSRLVVAARRAATLILGRASDTREHESSSVTEASR